ncbi:MAG: hypothetical protein HOW97_14205 [Catenulispora sp.]|nr:hypothetical protein [Catenulispora sp.]
MKARRALAGKRGRRVVAALSATALALTMLTTAAPTAVASSRTPRTVAQMNGPGTLTADVDAEVADLEAMLANVLPEEPDLPPDVQARLSAFTGRQNALEQKVEALPESAEGLDERTTAFNEEADTYDQQATANDEKTTQFNAKAADHEAKVDAHNAEPHTFTPDQAAEAAAYDAEADALNSEKTALEAEKSSLQTEQDRLNSEKDKLTTEKDAIQKDLDAFASTVEGLTTEVQQLDNDRLSLLEEVAADEQALADRQSAPSTESFGAADAAAGGDAPQPPDESGAPAPAPRQTRQTDPTAPAQPDPQLTESTGGDVPSRSGQNSALDSYAAQHHVTVDERPVAVRLTPQTVHSLTPEQAAQISLSTTFQGLVREPSGNYEAVEVLAPGTTFGPGDVAFYDAVNGGGKAIGLVNGSQIVIDKVGAVQYRGAPAATGDPGATAPPQDQNEPTDCTKRKPAGADALPKDGWVEYWPLGPNDRAQGMEACLVDAGKVQDTAPDVNIAGWDPAVKRAYAMFGTPPAKNPLAKCHFLAARFGGSNKDQRNFTACWQEPVNNSAMKSFENLVAKKMLARAGLIVTFVESAVYDQASSDTPSEYWLIAVGQVPGTDELIPVESLPIPNEKLIDGKEQTIGN